MNNEVLNLVWKKNNKIERITTSLAAQQTGWSERYIRKLIQEKKIEAEKFGPRIWAVDYDSLMKFYKENK